ncbi:hypothetical protein IJ182_01230 [bacterium]|nr:hypothetical protein [bacterium]
MGKSNLAVRQYDSFAEKRVLQTNSLKLVSSKKNENKDNNIYYLLPEYAPNKTVSAELKLIHSELLLSSSPIICGFVFMFACMIQTIV